MAQYDGEIRIKTEIDQSGVKKGTKEMKSEAMKLAAEYRKSGMTQSEALKKAWEDIERTSKKGSNSVKNDVEKMNKGITSSFKGLALSLVGVLGFREIVQYAKEASKASIDLESSMLRTNAIFGESNKAITDFADQTAFSLGMSKKAAYEYAAVYGNLFMSMAGSAEENKDLTLKYLEASAVVASKTGRTMQDVQERIRSGVLGNTEAIEDLGIEARVGMLEMTEVFKKVADGRTWEKLTYYEQQQVRVLGILEQANQKYGDTVTNSSAFAVMQFSAAMENLKTTIGNIINVAFIPLINTATTLAALMNNILVTVFGEAAQTQTDIAQSATKAAAGQSKLADSTNKASKAAKNALANFDELNILQKNVADTSGEAVGLGVSSGAGVKTKVESEKFEPPKGTERFTKAIAELGEAFSDIKTSIFEFWNTPEIKDTFGAISSDVAVRSIEGLTGVVNILSGVFQILTGVTKEASGQLSGDTAKAAAGTADIFAGAASVIDGVFLLLFREDMREDIKGFFDFWVSKTSEWWTNDVAPWFTKEKWQSLFGGIKLGFEGGWALVVGFWNTLGPTVWWKNSVSLWFTKEKWQALFTGVKTGFSAGWQSVVTWWNESGPTAWWKNNVSPWFTTEKWRLMLLNVRTAFSAVFGLIGADIETNIKNAINGIITILNFLIDSINKIKIDVPEWVPGVGGQSYGTNLNKIPKLAAGAVIKPASPFLAMLGDQPSGINIETPLETMLEAFREALQEMGGGGQVGEAVLVLDGTELGRATIPYINAEQKRRGTNLLIR